MPHILIVEDEPTTSWALAEGLSDDGYTIDTFRTAEEALVWLRGHRSDLVITDFRLPGLSGLELAQKLSRGRSAPKGCAVSSSYFSSGHSIGLRSSGSSPPHMPASSP